MAQIGEDDRLAGYIINMIRLDYFDEAVGPVEGFDILRNLLRCGKADSSFRFCVALMHANR